jgi:hypothetical protein
MKAFLWREKNNEREKGPVLILCGPCQRFTAKFTCEKDSRDCED